MTNTQTPNKEYYTFEAAFKLVVRGIDEVLVKSPLTIRRFIAYLSRSKGKLMRSQLLLCCALNQENMIDGDAVPAAIGVELLHLATLIHDDIIDEGDTRRSLPTLNQKFGRKIAVIAGDYLLAKSLEQAQYITSKEAHLKRNISVPNYMTKLCLGEISQLANNGNLDLTTRRYLNIIRGKTATLFEAACFTGGALVSDSDAQYEAYKKFGCYLGMVFQISDDIIDYEAEKQNAGKNVQSDFEQGVITLPLIYALQESPQAKAAIVKKQQSSFDVLAFVKSSNGLQRAKATSERYYKRAVMQLDNMQINAQKRSRLIYYLDKAYRGLEQ